MNVALTGGSGFLGLALVRALLRDGHRVRALVRRADAGIALRALGAETIRGDLTRPGGCAGLVSPGDTVIHAAARVAMAGRWPQFQRDTIDSTRNVLAAALPHRPARFVYVSSAGVYGTVGARDGYAAGRVPAQPARYNFYGRAKLAAEQLVQRECASAACPWTILRLGFLYGPGNRALLDTFVPLLELGRLFVIGDGSNRIATLHVDDAAHAILLAACHPTAVNHIYDVAGEEQVTQRQFLSATAAALDLPWTPRSLSRRSAYVVAWLIESLAALRGVQPRICRALIDLMSTDQVLDASRIRTELGWRPQVGFWQGARAVCCGPHLPRTT